jgi:hypothetical protein
MAQHAERFLDTLRKAGPSGLTNEQVIRKLKIEPSIFGRVLGGMRGGLKGNGSPNYHVNGSGRYVYGKKRGRQAVR